jgi:23S rRNA pseudouridine1911/1915/1917 synthase
MNYSKNRETEKTYWAIVKNKPERAQAKLIHYIKRNEKQYIQSSYKKEVPDSKLASLDYTL